MKVTKLASISICAFLCLGSAASADSPGMYSRQKRSEKEGKKIAVTYAIEVIRNGKVSNVPSSYAFRKGDDVRFHVQSNTDGYMYILASGVDGGQYDVIYPPEDAKETGLKKGQDYHLPQKGLKITNSNSLKSIKLVFSKSKLDTDVSQGIKITGFSNPPPIANTAAGLPSLTKPPSFSGENSTTVVLENSIKPLGMEIKVKSSP